MLSFSKGLCYTCMMKEGNEYEQCITFACFHWKSIYKSFCVCFMHRFFGHIHASSAGFGLLSGKLLGFPMSCRMLAFKLDISCCGAAPTPAKAAFHGLAAKKLRGACMTCHTQANGLIKPSGEVLRRERCSF